MVATTELADARKGDKTNLKYMKTRLSEKYETIPSNNIDQFIQQTADNPLSLDFVVMNKKDVNEYIQMNAEIVMNGLTAGKSYGISFILSPQTRLGGWSNVANGVFEYSLKVNGFNVVKKTYTKAEMDAFSTAQGQGSASARIAGAFADQYGINVPGTTATFTFNVTVPRNPTATANR